MTHPEATPPMGGWSSAELVAYRDLFGRMPLIGAPEGEFDALKQEIERDSSLRQAIKEGLLGMIEWRRENHSHLVKYPLFHH